MLKIFKKLKFFKPKNYKYVIFDKKGKEIIEQFIKKKFFILNTNYDSINLFILFVIILKGKKINSINYFIYYIKFLNPNIIFHHSVNINFFKLKRFFPKIKFVFIQSEALYDNFYNKIAKYKNCCDYFFLWGKNDFNKFKSFNKAHFYLMGSIHNNKFKIERKLKKNKSITYISQFRFKKSINVDNGIKVPFHRFYKADIEILKKLKYYSERKKLKLYILGCQNKYYKEEKYFYDKILESKYHYIRKKNYNYSQLKLFENFVSINSTLAFEILSRSIPVALFSIRQIFFCEKLSHYQIHRGSIWTSINSSKEFNRVMNNLIKLKKNRVSRKIKNYFDNFIVYDYLNKNLKTNLNKIINYQ